MNSKELIGKNLYMINYTNKLIVDWEVYEIRRIDKRSFGIFRFYLNPIVGTRNIIDLALGSNLNSLKSIIRSSNHVTTSKKAFENFIKTHTMV